MIKTNILKGVIAKCGLSQAQLAKQIGISPKTFYTKMQKGVFGSDEIEAMIHILGIKNPVQIFFAEM